MFQAKHADEASKDTDGLSHWKTGPSGSMVQVVLMATLRSDKRWHVPDWQRGILVA